jgi:hypothetical protein
MGKGKGGGNPMMARNRIAIALIALACVAPAHAGDRQDPFAGVEALLDPRILLQGVVREDDVTVLFAHLKAALLASYEGREAPAPEELNRRVEAMAAELKARGTLAGLLLLATFEAAARQALRDIVPAPAPVPR